MKYPQKLLSIILTILITLSALTGCTTVPTGGQPEGTTEATTAATTEAFSNDPANDIAILYTNDTHTYIDGPLSFDVAGALKQELQKSYAQVLLVDAGDHSQGTAYGAMDQGKTITDLMNAAGYDAATLGNHEFDYGMFGCMQTIDRAEFPYISCNFYHEANGVRGENVLPGYVTFPCGVAFVGITTPETFSKTTPRYFQDENGNFIYGISAGEGGSALYADVQNAIDEAKAAGATIVIGLGHLGTEDSARPWTSKEVIANTSGLSAFIDGHSHYVMEAETVADQNGQPVILTQTGEYFERIGLMILDPDTGSVTCDLIECTEVLAADGKTVTGHLLSSDLYPGTELIYHESTRQIKDSWMTEIDNQIGQKVGYTDLVLDNYDGETRLVRKQETNSGDFTADALYYLFDNMDMDVDLAIMNGGGIRNQAVTGDLTYKICKDIHTFGNVACLQTITGQQLLDMLEWGSQGVGTDEASGSFLQVAGITYEIHSALPCTVQTQDFATEQIWAGSPTGEYRVKNVQVYNKETQAYEPLDLNANYNLAGYNYTLRDLGDGFAMLLDAVNVLDYVMEDYMVLANYIQGFENSTVGATNSPLLQKYPNMLLDYSSVFGCGRITIH